MRQSGAYHLNGLVVLRVGPQPACDARKRSHTAATARRGKEAKKQRRGWCSYAESRWCSQPLVGYPMWTSLRHRAIAPTLSLSLYYRGVFASGTVSFSSRCRI